MSNTPSSIAASGSSSTLPGRDPQLPTMTVCTLIDRSGPSSTLKRTRTRSLSRMRPHDRIDVGEPADLLLELGVGVRRHLRVEADARHHHERLRLARAVGALDLDDAEVDAAVVPGERRAHRIGDVGEREVHVAGQEVAGPGRQQRQRDVRLAQTLGRRAHRAVAAGGDHDVDPALRRPRAPGRSPGSSSVVSSQTLFAQPASLSARATALRSSAQVDLRRVVDDGGARGGGRGGRHALRLGTVERCRGLTPAVSG